jgi:hypothetical protein
MARNGNLILIDHIQPLIQTVRGHKILLDKDLATLYGVTTKRLNEQVLRNLERFPGDFMFQLSEDDVESLRSQIATSKPKRGGRRYLPYAFTEHGAIMAASVLNSPQAVEVSVFVGRAFVKLRQWLADHKELSEKMAELERRVTGHDEAIRQLVAAIKQLMSSPAPPKKREIGFHARVSDNASPQTKARKRIASKRATASK